mgnify:CR=1 FL=1
MLVKVAANADNLTCYGVLALMGAIPSCPTALTAGRTATQGTDVFEARTTHRPLESSGF